MIFRRQALRAGGTIAAAVLAERNVAIILRDTLFVHGGLVRRTFAPCPASLSESRGRTPTAARRVSLELHAFTHLFSPC